MGVQAFDPRRRACHRAVNPFMGQKQRAFDPFMPAQRQQLGAQSGGV